MLVLSLEVTKCLSKKQAGKTLIRLLLLKQSDLGLHCLFKHFWKTTVTQNFRTSTYTLILLLFMGKCMVMGGGSKMVIGVAGFIQAS